MAYQCATRRSRPNDTVRPKGGELVRVLSQMALSGAAFLALCVVMPVRRLMRRRKPDEKDFYDWS